MGQYDVRSGPDLGAAIAEVRLASGLTQAELAKMAGLTATYVSKLENGRSTSLLDHEIRMLRRLGATITIEFGHAPLD
jgi:HTH-type transcriptional regulator/antitoxin HipB